LADAIRLAGTADCDAALLDVNLNGEMSWDAADLLQERKIPFIFTTGYDGATILPPRFATKPVVSKPFGDKDISRALRALLG
jgi:CheY-like chemotaxis protein